MKLEQSNLIVKRAYKEVYKCDEGIVKVFEKTHSKADVFNEALNTARVEEAGLDIPKVRLMENGRLLLNTKTERHLER